MTIGRIPSVEGGIQPTIVDAKGDILTATAADTPAVLAVGNNGETLVADSSATTGLRWQGNFAAGKNKLINGNFGINQRNFSSVTADATFTFDRWRTVSGGTVSYAFTPQTFTAGSAPVAGYEGNQFLQCAITTSSGSAYVAIGQRIEDVRTFAGETITVSFWAKATSGTPSIDVVANQDFGSGGSGSVNTIGTKQTISTSWARYSFTLSIPSISGKTIGTSSFLFIYITFSDNAIGTNVGNQTGTFQIWGVQAESGNVATAFQTATGTLAGELAACQRYYVRFGGANSYEMIGQGNAYSSTNANILVTLPVTLRVGATSIDYSTLALQKQGADPVYAITGLTLEQTGKNVAAVTAVIGSSSLTGAINYRMFTNNSTSGYLGFSAEL